MRILLAATLLINMGHPRTTVGMPVSRLVGKPAEETALQQTLK